MKIQYSVKNPYHWPACKVSRNHTRTCWVLKCDIRKFFASIDHRLLKDIFVRYISDEGICRLLDHIIDSVPAPYLSDAIAEISTRRGLPLGNLTSQLLVNIYLNEFDQFVKHRLKAKYYIRCAQPSSTLVSVEVSYRGRYQSISFRQVFMVNFLAILACGVVAVVLGSVWYHPRVFGTAWMRMANITPEQAEKGKKRMPLTAFFGFLAAMFTAWVMSFVLPVFGVFDWIGAVEIAFWLWAGFIAPVMLGIVLWESKPFMLYVLNVSYWLILLVVFAVVLAW